MANPLLSLNENFSYNSMLARALLPLIPVKDKHAIHSWLHVLHDMSENADEMTIRNEYMWFMLIQLQNKRITEPFNHPPHSRKLPPLREILPSHIYEEVLTTSEKNQSWLEHPGDASTSDVTGANGNEEPQSSAFSSPPAEFLQNQPMPRNGIICYFAAFSDQNY